MTRVSITQKMYTMTQGSYCLLVKDHLEDHPWEGDVNLLHLGQNPALSVEERITGPENVPTTSLA